jgi:hypothetical protein
LITRLLSISGRGPIDISKLEENYTYSFISHDTLVKVDPEGLPLPDEFWSEERVNNWKKEYDKIYNSSSDDDSESVPF